MCVSLCCTSCKVKVSCGKSVVSTEDKNLMVLGKHCKDYTSHKVVLPIALNVAVKTVDKTTYLMHNALVVRT